RERPARDLHNKSQERKKEKLEMSFLLFSKKRINHFKDPAGASVPLVIYTIRVKKEKEES
uniref:hypothetical protein n=1 Tax=uncultured Nonlabens sp. TaxID=859306 RepID=UPI0030D8233A